MPKCIRFGWFLPYAPADNEYGAWKHHYVACVSNLDWLTPREAAAVYGTLNEPKTGDEELQERQREKCLRKVIWEKIALRKSEWHFKTFCLIQVYIQIPTETMVLSFWSSVWVAFSKVCSEQTLFFFTMYFKLIKKNNKISDEIYKVTYQRLHCCPGSPQFIRPKTRRREKYKHGQRK